MYDVVLATLQAKAPAAVNGVLRLVGVKLLGAALEWPEAWLKEKAQAIRDRSDARSIIWKSVAAEAAMTAKADPDRLAAMIDLAFDGLADRVNNKADIFRRSLVQISEMPPERLESAAVPDTDWMNAFIRYSEDASSDEMRDTFARILAGEIVQKGAFSRAALRVVSELRMETAKSFEKFYSSTIDTAQFQDIQDEQGLSSEDILILGESGLVHTTNVSINAREVSQDDDFICYELVVKSLKFSYKSKKYEKFGSFAPFFMVTLLTNMGREISQLLPRPDELNNMRMLARVPPDSQDIISVQLMHEDGTVENLLG